MVFIITMFISSIYSEVGSEIPQLGFYQDRLLLDYYF